MSGYVLSPDALQDLQDIWDFIAFDNSKAADRFEDEFFATFEKLSRQPGMGHTRPDLSDRGVLFWPINAYLVVYRKLHKRLQIVAILHGSRDVPEVMRRRFEHRF